MSASCSCSQRPLVVFGVASTQNSGVQSADYEADSGKTGFGREGVKLYTE